MAEFRPSQLVDGYLPLADYGLIGDGTTAALVGRDATIAWLCVPHFDSPPLFSSILDARPGKGGQFRLSLDGLTEARQRYADDTGVLVTELRSSEALVTVTDALTLHKGADLSEDTTAARQELIRVVRVVNGHARLHVDISPRETIQQERASGGVRLRCPSRPDLDLYLTDSFGLNAPRGVVNLSEGEEGFFLLRWGPGKRRLHAASVHELLDQTLAAWRRWIRRFSYDGPQSALVRRSAITLKLLDHFENGAIVAAPTSSLPERIGGVRNWDYRYAWIRDAAFSVYALRRIGFAEEALGFLAWVLQAIEREGRPRVLYNLRGEIPPPEREDPELEGYRKSRPVRWGNAAVEQQQHDVFGEILDCAWQWVSGGQTLDTPLLNRLDELVNAAATEWRTPDAGIWEMRRTGLPFTYSAALCQVALDRGARLWQRLGLPGNRERWQREAAEIQTTILDQAWSKKRNALAAHLGGDTLDASVLALPLRRVIPFDHPRMIATTNAISEHLGAGGGLLHRYDVDELPDGLPHQEGAFLLCSFWLVDNLAGQGRLEEAGELFASLCARANPLGLLPEQIDPATGLFLGNYPQAFSHVGVISSGVNLARRLHQSTARR